MRRYLLRSPVIAVSVRHLLNSFLDLSSFVFGTLDQYLERSPNISESTP